MKSTKIRLMNKNDYIINQIDPFFVELDIQESQFQMFFK